MFVPSEVIEAAANRYEFAAYPSCEMVLGFPEAVRMRSVVGTSSDQKFNMCSFHLSSASDYEANHK